MAKAIAHITGTALRPGVSRNKRWYKPEHIAGMVTSAQQRIGEGRKPMVMLSFHGAEDNSREITAALTSMTLEDDGAAGFTADIIGTEAGRDIAALADSTDGKPALSTVSIRGAWTGRVRKERGPDGQMVETADGLELDGVDWTKAPGVDGAEIKTFSWVTDGQTETTERVLITESVQEAAVTFTEEGLVGEAGPESFVPAEAGRIIPVVPEPVREAIRAVFAPAEAHVLEGGLCATCGSVEEAKKGPNTKPYGDVPYADTGYLDADGNQASKSGKPGIKRYPLDKKHIRAAWSYINQAKNAAQYTATQLKRIKGRIKAAMRSIGAKVSAESDVVAGFVISEAVQATPEVLEWMGEDPKRAGSWSVSASNGPVNLNLSSYCMDPADLDVILRAAANAVCDALKALDPDMDGDIDVPGAGDNSDTDHDGGHESTPSPLTTETEPAADAGDEGPAPAGTEEQEDAGMATENSTEGGAVQSGLSNEALAKLVSESAAAAVTAAFEAREAAKAEAKRAAKEAEDREAAESAARKTALTEALAELGIKIPAPGTGAAGTTESTTDTVTESVDDRVKREVTEAITEFKQGLIAGGAILPARAGLVVREHAIDADTAPDGEALRKMSDDELTNYLGGALAQQADTIRPVGAGA